MPPKAASGSDRRHASRPRRATASDRRAARTRAASAAAITARGPRRWLTRPARMNSGRLTNTITAKASADVCGWNAERVLEQHRVEREDDRRAGVGGNPGGQHPAEAAAHQRPPPAAARAGEHGCRCTVLNPGRAGRAPLADVARCGARCGGRRPGAACAGRVAELAAASAGHAAAGPAGPRPPGTSAPIASPVAGAEPAQPGGQEQARRPGRCSARSPASRAAGSTPACGLTLDDRAGWRSSPRPAKPGAVTSASSSWSGRSRPAGTATGETAGQAGAQRGQQRGRRASRSARLPVSGAANAPEVERAHHQADVARALPGRRPAGSRIGVRPTAAPLTSANGREPGFEQPGGAPLARWLHGASLLPAVAGPGGGAGWRRGAGGGPG